MNELEPELSNLQELLSESKKSELSPVEVFIIIGCFYKAKEAGLTYNEVSAILEKYGFVSNFSYTVKTPPRGEPRPYSCLSELVDTIVSKMLKNTYIRSQYEK